MEETLLLAIVIPGGIVCMLSVCMIAVCKFIHVRRKPLRVLVPVSYLPERVMRSPEVIPDHRPMTKREARAARLKKLSRRAEIQAVKRQQQEILKSLQEQDQTEHIEANDEDQMSEDDDVPYELFRASIPDLSRVLRRVSALLNLRSSLGIPISKSTSGSVGPEEGNEDGSMAGVLSLAREMEDALQTQNSSPSATTTRKSYTPQRMMKIEKRRQSILSRKSRFQSRAAEWLDMEEVDDLDDDQIVNILTAQPIQQLKRDRLIGIRKAKRQEEKLEALRQGQKDEILLNSGPPSTSIPPGYQCLLFIDTLSLDFLMYKRIMYYMEFVEQYKPSGWYIATIVGASKQRDCNFNIKFDRAETGTLFVDGVHAVLLTFDGLTAYGRKWMIVQRFDAVAAAAAGGSAAEGQAAAATSRSTPNIRSSSAINRMGSPMLKRKSLGLDVNFGPISPSTLSIRLKTPMLASSRPTTSSSPPQDSQQIAETATSMTQTHRVGF